MFLKRFSQIFQRGTASLCSLVGYKVAAFKVGGLKKNLLSAHHAMRVGSTGLSYTQWNPSQRLKDRIFAALSPTEFRYNYSIENKHLNFKHILQAYETGSSFRIYFSLTK